MTEKEKAKAYDDLMYILCLLYNCKEDEACRVVDLCFDHLWDECTCVIVNQTLAELVRRYRKEKGINEEKFCF